MTAGSDVSSRLLIHEKGARFGETGAQLDPFVRTVKEFILGSVKESGRLAQFQILCQDSWSEIMRPPTRIGVSSVMETRRSQMYCTVSQRPAL